MKTENNKLIIVLAIVFVLVLIGSIYLNGQKANAETLTREYQVDCVKAQLQDAEDEEQTREQTNQLIKAEKAEQARLEAERLAREQAEREAEQARQEAERQAEIQQAQQVQEQTQNNASQSVTTPQSGTLTKEGGVNYYNGSRETWYSSNQLYHYRTSEWTADSEGFYRDAQGRYVVASNNYPNGTEIETSKGKAIVEDKGCNGVDFYVNF